MQSLPRYARIPVWPPQRSLAATYGIDVSFFSSGYLDVSVRRVPFHTLSFSDMDDRSSSCRVSPFRYLRIAEYLLLPAAFRSLSRLSSALSAKASALCPFLFDLSVLPYSVMAAVRCSLLFTSFSYLMSFLFFTDSSMQFSRCSCSGFMPDRLSDSHSTKKCLFLSCRCRTLFFFFF